MVSFPDAIRKGFEGYAQFSGRSTRAEYWWWSLFYTVVAVVAGIINGFIFGEVNILGLVVFLVLLVPNIAVAIRRSHDIGKSAWWVLWQFFGWCALLLPGLVMWLLFRTRQGDRGPNQYGPDPRDDSQEISYTGEAEESTDDSQPDEIHCPVCSVGNKANSKFCKQCGGSLENAT